MEIKSFNEKHLEEVGRLIYDTIDACYSGVYRAEAIDYFKKFHSKDNIMSNAEEGDTIVLSDVSGIIGTGTLFGKEIRRVFVLKEFQGQGLGKLIMSRLESIASRKGIGKVVLCSSLVSKAFYDRLGYVTVKEDYIDLGNGEKLYYYDMYKDLKSGNNEK